MTTITPTTPPPSVKKGSSKVQMMIVDDSAVIRTALKSIISGIDEIEIAAIAKNGQDAVGELKRNKDIEIIVLDIEMPIMDGITALPKLLEVKKDVTILMASTLTLRNADISLKAMSLGATDYIPKPSDGSSGTFKEDLRRKLRSFAAIKRMNAQKAASGESFEKKVYKTLPLPIIHPKVLGIGSSTGGPQTLVKIFQGLKGVAINVPILITQHMPPMFTTMLAKSLHTASGRETFEAEDGMSVEPGKIYLAPGDYHMVVEVNGAFKKIRLNQDPPEHFCRPSVNPMFRSLAAAYPSGALGLILTGMGSDGIEGAKEIISKGGAILSQDEKTSVVWGMPAAIANAGISSGILPLDNIPDAIINGLKGKRLKEYG